MSITASIQLRKDPGHGLRRLARRVPRGLWIVLAIALSWSAEVALYRAFAPPGEALRRELQGAAGELGQQILPQPTPSVGQAIRRHFRESAVDVDTTRLWPNVAVSLSAVPRAECADAVRKARRIDGLVVVRLEGYRSAEDCRARNVMTWWLMP